MPKPRNNRYVTVSLGRNKNKLAHVLIAERVLGRPLPKAAQAHHVNGNGRDNRHQNLVICEDGGYHRLLHVRQRVLDAGENPDADYVCGICKLPKPRDQFFSTKRCYCRSCRAEYGAAYRLKHADRIRNYQANYRALNQGELNARQRAKRAALKETI